MSKNNSLRPSLFNPRRLLNRSHLLRLTDPKPLSALVVMLATVLPLPALAAPFSCTSTFYQVYSDDGVTSKLVELGFGATPTTNQLGTYAGQVNAAGYNPVDNYLYALVVDTGASQNHLIRFEQDGTSTDLGLVSGLSGKMISGDFDSAGNYYVKNAAAKNSNLLYKIDIATLSATSITLDTTEASADITYHPVKDKFYAVNEALGLIEYTLTGTTGTVVTYPLPDFPYGSGATFYADGYLYAYNSATGQVGKIDVDTRAASIVGSTVSSLGSNDGASCPSAPTPRALLDSDGDGVSDDLDIDEDNDGIPDSVEDAGAPLVCQPITSTDLNIPADVTAYTTGPVDVSHLFTSLPTGSVIVNGTLVNTVGGGFKVSANAQMEFFVSGTEPVYIQAGHGGALGAGLKDKIFTDGTPYTLMSTLAAGLSTGENVNPGYFVSNDTATKVNDDDFVWRSNETDTYIKYGTTSDALNSRVSLALCAYEHIDTDADGRPDYLDSDSDNDGVPDALEGHDANSDGVADAVASGIDTDGDGLDDAFDADNGGTTAPTQDTDADGTPDFRDNDDDGDGALTSAEDANTDADGNPATTPTDSDGDGKPDYLDAVADVISVDTDGDGINDDVDIDDDNDGILDVAECPLVVAPDSSYVSIPWKGSLDSSGNGSVVVDGVTVTFATLDGGYSGGYSGITSYNLVTYGVNNDPTERRLSLTFDTAVNLRVDGRDLQAGTELWSFDQDIIYSDLHAYHSLEGNKLIVTTGGNNGEGGTSEPSTVGFENITTLLAGYSSNGPNGSSHNGSLDNFRLVKYALPECDIDNDGIPDQLDLDADNDGITDNIEAQIAGNFTAPSGVDSDGNGLDDAYESAPAAGEGITPTDSDGDATADYQDTDSDSDGVPDATEGHDANGDGVADAVPTGTDTDGDGLDDAFDTDNGGTTAPTQDTDGDVTPDFRDNDDDGDGVLTSAEDANTDTDGNPATDPTDTDGDGTPDYLQAASKDTDGDGIPDTVDTDDDNDGILDTVEGDGAVDTDGDGTPDSLDTDSDGDGVPDALEGHDANSDGVADAVATGTDTDGDGLDDAFDADNSGTTAPAQDTDGDGTPDFRDTDDDGDGALTSAEDANSDADGNPATNPTDTDGDGKPDYLDAVANPMVAITVRALLQGPYDSATGLMHDTLRAKGMIPNAQPYAQATAWFDYQGNETANNSLLSLEGNDAPVDWVLVELRDADQQTRIAALAGLVQRDGDIVDAATGSATLRFDNVASGSYYVTVLHRNHLDVTTATQQALSATATMVDFTLPGTAVMGDYARLEGTEVAVMWSGDVNKGNDVIANGPGSDTTALFSAVMNEALANSAFGNANYLYHVYDPADVNMDGIAIYSGPDNDSNYIIGNVLLHPENNSFQGNFIMRGRSPVRTVE